MRDKYIMYAVITLGVLLLSGLIKQKACQNSDSGDLSARPWYWPCPKGSYTTKSASTN